jgi:hypothetical protein
MNNETQHTAGPWAWQRFGDTYSLTAQHGMREIIIGAIKHGSMGYPVVGMNSDGILRDVDPAHPNATLIASAPSLLKENQELKERVKELEDLLGLKYNS